MGNKRQVAHTSLLILFLPSLIIFSIDAYLFFKNIGLGWFSYQYVRYNFVSMLVVLIQIIMIPASLFLYKRNKISFKEVLGKGKKGRVKAVLIMFTVFWILIMFEGFLNPIIMGLSFEEYGKLWISLKETLPLSVKMIFALVMPVTASIGEEFFFRGFGVKCLLSLGKKKALLLSSISFGIWHGLALPLHALFAAVAGYLFGYYYLKIDNLRIIILTHFLIDIVGFIRWLI
jgi:hypothetical protein